MSKSTDNKQYFQDNKQFRNSEEVEYVLARRTAFIARFIVLREAKRSRTHREIEDLTWDQNTTAEELAQRIRNLFLKNDENIKSVDRDIKRALSHANRTLKHFVQEYVKRATNSFVEALIDYHRSNLLLFGADDEHKKLTGWMGINEIKQKLKQQT